MQIDSVIKAEMGMETETEMARTIVMKRTMEGKFQKQHLVAGKKIKQRNDEICLLFFLSVTT